jgi:X-Pro dipeptidyl-peptidase
MRRDRVEMTASIPSHRAPAVLVSALAVFSLVFGGAVGSAAPEHALRTESPDKPLDHRPYVLHDGVTQPVYSYEDAIRESVWVQAPDGDGDGKKDLVTADIIRPSELDGVTTVPVIMEPSPYYLCCGRGNEGERKTYDADEDPLKFPLFYDNFFEPRGYAIVQVDMAGTARSTGCSDEGALSDVRSVKAVIDWLGGRATAIDIHGNPVTATWANGIVGMIGKSYDGTLADAVAATGVAGLKTVVPIAAISSWYDYDRSQGLPFSFDYPAWLSSVVAVARTRQVDCSAINTEMNQEDADETGAYTPFWSKRDDRADPVPSAARVRASVFLVHGLQDTNVRTLNFGRWYPLLVDRGVVTKVWLSRLGHADPFDYRRLLWVQTLHRWFDNQLMGIENGILDEPRVDVETSPDTWVTGDSWPVFDNQERLTFHADGSLTSGPPETGTATFTNDPNQSEAEAIAEGDNPNRLLYLTGSLQEDVRLSGEPTVNLKITPQGAVGQVGVALVDYGTQVRVKDDGEGNKTLGTQSCWGASTSYDDSCYYDSVENQLSTSLAVLARGWARLTGDQANTVTVHLAYNDVVIPAGHQLGLAIFGASPDWLVNLDTHATPYAVDLATSSLTLPLVGSVSFGPNAGDFSQVPRRIPPGTLPTPASPEARLPS